MKITEVELVINVNFGGFSFDTEMALWLSENCGWTIIPEKNYNYKEKYSITTLIDMKGNLFISPNDGVELRSNKDLINCVRAVHALHENDDFPDSHYGHIHNLAIRKVDVHLEIIDHHDGIEKINCQIIESDEEE
jgi:hypothetical protein